MKMEQVKGLGSPKLSNPTIDLLDVGVLILDRKLRVVEWSLWLANASSITSEQAQGKPLPELFPEALRGRLRQAITHALEAQLSSTLSSAINRHVLPLTKTVGVSMQQVRIAQSITVKPIAYNGNNYCLICISDVTDTVKREGVLRNKSNQLQKLADALEISEQKTRCIIESSLDSVLTFDSDGTILSMNPAARALFWQDSSVTDDTSIYEFLPDLRDATEASGFDRLAIDGLGSWPKINANRRCGEPILVEYSINRIEAESETFYTAVVHDLTERQAVEKKLKRLAQFDSLTNLANRSLFADVLTETVADAKNKGSVSALLLLDLDRFKSINDSLGHQAGDELLRQVSARLTGCVRDNDLVARLGGDEFAIVLADVCGDRDGKSSNNGVAAAQDIVTRAAERVIKVFRNPFNLQSREVHASASVGIAMCDNMVASAESLTKSADVAMYTAKGKGRNNYQFYTTNLDRLAEVKLSLENSLHQALRNRELTLHYQPQINRLSGEICGVEALLRWRHPTRGDISPTVFVPLLEEAGLILQVGEWIMSEAFQQRRLWADSGLLERSATMAINVSARQFNNRLVDCVANSIHEAGIDPAMVEIELTESTLMENTEETNAVLAGLHDLGVGISIDDFGTGYSSLSYLKNFPFSSLKVDKSFVIDIDNNKSSSSIAEAVIGLAHTMGLKVIAEGVETPLALRVLNRYQCDVFQGFYFARPMCADDFEEYARNRDLKSARSPSRAVLG